VFAALRYDAGGDFTASYKFDWAKGNFVGDARVTPVINTLGERVTVGTNPDGSPIKANFPVPNALGTLLTQLIAAQPAGGGRFGPITLNPNDRRPDAANQSFATKGFQRVQGHNLSMEWQASDSITVKNTLGYRKNAVFSGGSTVAGLSGLEFNAGGIVPYSTFVALSTVPGFGTLPASQQGPIIQQIAANFAPLANAGLYFAPYEGQSYGRHWQVSDELQVNYTADRLNITAGLLYYQSRTKDSGLPGFTPNIAFAPTSTTISLGNAAQGIGHQQAIGKTKSYAAYAQVEFDITEQLGIVAGGRWTKDDKYGIFQDRGTFVGSRTGEGTINFANTIDGTFKKSRFTYSIGLNYQPNDDMLFYAKYATGFLSGGIYADIAFPAETAKSWEAGAKLDLLDRRVRFNIAAYKADYTNAQATSSGRAIGRSDLPIAVISNGKLKAKGVELDVTLAPFDGFTVGGTVGYTKSSFDSPDPRLADGYDIKPSGQPGYVGTVNAQYVTQPLFGDANLLIRADMIFQSKSRVIGAHQVVVDFPVFAPYEFIPAKQLVNARLALRDVSIGGANWEFGLWAKNLFDNKKPLYPFQYPYFLMTTSYEKARTYGLDVIVKFNP
jgi:iron complex outermembrane receptor protein